MRAWIGVFLVLPGCSFAFVSGPPPETAQRAPFDCTTSHAAPIVDTVFAGWQAVRVGLALVARDEAYAEAPISRGADIGFGVGLFVLSAASASYGYSTVRRCAVAKGVAESRSRFRRRAPQEHRVLCTKNEDCPQGYYCVTVQDATFCSIPREPLRKAPVSAGQPCEVDTDCPSGGLCVVRGREKICRPR